MREPGKGERETRLYTWASVVLNRVNGDPETGRNAACARAEGMLWPKRYVEMAANGHLTLSRPSAGPLLYSLLCWRLRLRHGLRREGREVISPDDIILPDFVTAGLRLGAGWDNWSGYYLIAQDGAGDTFLERLARKDLIHNVGKRFRTEGPDRLSEEAGGLRPSSEI